LPWENGVAATHGRATSDHDSDTQIVDCAGVCLMTTHGLPDRTKMKPASISIAATFTALASLACLVSATSLVATPPRHDAARPWMKRPSGTCLLQLGHSATSFQGQGKVTLGAATWPADAAPAGARQRCKAADAW
jgi:hypothetical protein